MNEKETRALELLWLLCQETAANDTLMGSEETDREIRDFLASLVWPERE